METLKNVNASVFEELQSFWLNYFRFGHYKYIWIYIFFNFFLFNFIVTV